MRKEGERLHSAYEPSLPSRAVSPRSFEALASQSRGASVKAISLEVPKPPVRIKSPVPQGFTARKGKASKGLVSSPP